MVKDLRLLYAESVVEDRSTVLNGEIYKCVFSIFWAESDTRLRELVLGYPITVKKQRRGHGAPQEHVIIEVEKMVRKTVDVMQLALNRMAVECWE